jgi:hypothetical protein
VAELAGSVAFVSTSVQVTVLSYGRKCADIHVPRAQVFSSNCLRVLASTAFSCKKLLFKSSFPHLGVRVFFIRAEELLHMRTRFILMTFHRQHCTGTDIHISNLHTSGQVPRFVDLIYTCERILTDISVIERM